LLTQAGVLSVRRLGLGEAAGLQDVDFCCAGGPDVSQPFHALDLGSPFGQNLRAFVLYLRFG
jgi:hypothetical protein